MSSRYCQKCGVNIDSDPEDWVMCMDCILGKKKSRKFPRTNYSNRPPSTKPGKCQG